MEWEKPPEGSGDDEMMGTNFLSAAREGRGEDMFYILRQDPTLIGITDPVGDTALHLVVKGGDAELVSKLVEFVKGQSLTDMMMEKNSQGNTPLLIAAKNGPFSETTACLYEANKDAMRVVNEDGESASDLMLDIFNTLAFFSDIQLNTVNQKLVDKTTNSQDEEDMLKRAWMELSLGVKSGQEDLVRRILEEDPTLVLYDKKNTLLHAAAEAGRVGMLRLLVDFMTPYKPLMSSALKGDKTDTKNPSTPLHIALYKGHQDAARYLIEIAPQTPYYVNCLGVSPLHVAAQKGHDDIVRYMFQIMPTNTLPFSIKDGLFAAQKNGSQSLANAAIKTTNLDILEAITKELPGLMDRQDYKGWRPLSYAAYTGFAQGVSYLLTNFPASVHVYDRDGSLPIHKAVGGGHVSAVKAFYLHSPQTLHGIDKNGQTILHFAVKCAKPAVLQYLTEDLEAEVKKIYELRDDKGKTFMDLANELK